MIDDFVREYPKACDINLFLSKYGKRLERLAIYQNQEVGESSDCK